MSPRTPGEGLLHPVAVAAVAVLALNDHWGKAAFPGLVTGKLSDVAGLLFFPLFLQAAIEVVQARRQEAFEPSRRLLVGLAVLTGLCFALVKLSPVGAEAYRIAFGALRWPLDAVAAWLQGASAPRLSKVSLTMDASDLIALPALALSVALGWSRSAERRAPRVPAHETLASRRSAVGSASPAGSLGHEAGGGEPRPVVEPVTLSASRARRGGDHQRGSARSRAPATPWRPRAAR